MANLFLLVLIVRDEISYDLLAAILFGFLYQGGAELALWTSIPRAVIVVIQALVILFTGALDNMVRMPLEKLFLAARKEKA